MQEQERGRPGAYISGALSCGTMRGLEGGPGKDLARKGNTGGWDLGELISISQNLEEQANHLKASVENWRGGFGGQIRWKG